MTLKRKNIFYACVVIYHERDEKLLQSTKQ